MLHIRYRPYGCRMLDTLQRGSWYALTISCFALMAPALDGILNTALNSGVSSDGVMAAALGIVGLLNVAVVGVFLYAMVLEGRRLALATLDRDNKGHITWRDIKAFVRDCLPEGWWCGCGCGGGGAEDDGDDEKGGAGRPGGGAQAGAAVGGPQVVAVGARGQVGIPVSNGDRKDGAVGAKGKDGAQVVSTGTGEKEGTAVSTADGKDGAVGNSGAVGGGKDGPAGAAGLQQPEKTG